MLKFIRSIINDPVTISWICFACIFFYYVVSGIFIYVAKKEKVYSWLKKGSLIDWATSLIWLACAVLLIISLFNLCVVRMTMKLNFLIIYYFLFIFLFAIIYGLLDWHWPKKMIEGAATDTWKAEGQYILISIQTQTTIGFTSVKPKSLGVEILTCIHALLGIFFITIFISLSINKFPQ